MKKYLNKKLFAYTILPIMVFVLVGAGTASAHGNFMGFGSNATPAEIAQMQTKRFNEEASLLGVSVDKVKQAWAEGKTLKELALANGITAEQLKLKLATAKQQQMKERFATLVSQGVITQAQADLRLSFIDKQALKGKAGRGHRFGK